jgi:hypothetical protein
MTSTDIMTIVGGGNVGIGTTVPGQLLDVQGTVRATGFTMSGSAPANTYVLTATDSLGDTTWTAPSSGVAGWSLNGTNVYTTTGSNNVGIGTSTPRGGFVVTNGNVGIGTWAPISTLSVAGNAVIGSGAGYLVNSVPANNLVVQSNIGIGTFTPAVALDIVTNNSATGIQLRGNQGAAHHDDIYITDSIGLTLSDNYGYIRFLTAPSSSNALEHMRITGAGNVGIGTITPVAQLAVAGSGVGIGTNTNDNYLTTTPPNGGMIVEGNVGIGSITPGQKFDVQGTVRTTGFTMSGSAPANTYVLTATDSLGDTTWTAPSSGVAGWSLNGTNVYTTTGSNNVGIGTSTPQGGLVVTNGNVGIGTWVPATALQVGTNTLTVNTSTGNVGIGSTAPGQVLDVNGHVRSGAWDLSTNYEINYLTGGLNIAQPGSSNYRLYIQDSSGNIGIGTWTPYGKFNVAGSAAIGSGYAGIITPPSNGLIVQSNVGIGSIVPGQILDVQGTVRTTGFTMSGSAPANTYVLTATDSLGDTTWTAPSSGVAGWSLSGTNVYTTTGSNNVGIGTSTPQGGLVVTNGNVGIGTWAPNASLNIVGSIAVTTVSKNSAYTATAMDHVILVDASGGAVTITLPAAAASSGRMYQIKKTDSSTNALTIKGNAAETIDGTNTISTTTQYQSYTLVCDGTQWWIV